MGDTAGLLLDAGGWAGAMGILVCYGLVSTGRLDARGLTASVVNAVGALLLAAVGAAHGVWSSAAANVVWCLIGVFALVRLGATARQARRTPPTQPTQPAPLVAVPADADRTLPSAA